MTHSAMQLRLRVPKRMFEALDRGDVGVFLRFWSALPLAGRPHHPLSAFTWAALNELGDQRMTGAQRFATDQRLASYLRAELNNLAAVGGVFRRRRTVRGRVSRLTRTSP